MDSKRFKSLQLGDVVQSGSLEFPHNMRVVEVNSDFVAISSCVYIRSKEGHLVNGWKRYGDHVSKTTHLDVGDKILNENTLERRVVTAIIGGVMATNTFVLHDGALGSPSNLKGWQLVIPQ